MRVFDFIPFYYTPSISGLKTSSMLCIVYYIYLYFDIIISFGISSNFVLEMISSMLFYWSLSYLISLPAVFFSLISDDISIDTSLRISGISFNSPISIYRNSLIFEQVKYSWESPMPIKYNILIYQNIYRVTLLDINS